MKGSLIVISFFLLGIVCGVMDFIPSWLLEGDVSFYALLALMFCVGVSIGCDADTLKRFKSLDRRLLFLPLFTIMGTLTGCAVTSLLVPDRGIVECLAIGSGLGYYSLSSIFITEYMGAEPGTIALISNIIREIVTLLCSPLLCRYFGRLAPISCGGATSMDTTLPIISSSCGAEFSVVSIYHGMLCDFSVPFLVSFFCTI